MRGTGWVAAKDLVVTSAHVVVGREGDDRRRRRRTRARRGRRRVRSGARPRVAAGRPSSARCPYARANQEPAMSAPPTDTLTVDRSQVTPARVSDTNEGQFEDLYGTGAVSRRALTVHRCDRARVIREDRSSNSWGRVVGVVFSQSAGLPDRELCDPGGRRRHAHRCDRRPSTPNAGPQSQVPSSLSVA